MVLLPASRSAASLVRDFGPHLTADIVHAMGPALTSELVGQFGGSFTSQLVRAFGYPLTAGEAGLTAAHACMYAHFRNKCVLLLCGAASQSVRKRSCPNCCV